MIKVLFICHGNICRSPMAEFVMKDLVKKAGMEDQFYIASAATSSEEIWRGVGNPVYPPARAEMEKHGIHCDGKRAVQMTREDYDNYDLLIGMDSNNIRNMKRIVGGDPEGKIHKMTEYIGESYDVADPWYSGDFKATWRDVSKSCQGLLDYLVSDFVNFEKIRPES